ncbi:MAG: hypothetical protein FWD61_20215 [Phycisphaerales bacterium]|nr:hypothetical protein [Phycisphaerales bacterium]
MMRLSARLVGAVLITMTSLMAASAFAGDRLRADGMTYANDVTIDGIKNGQLSTRIMGKDRSFDLSRVEWMELEGQPNFNKAEDNRKKDVKTAAAAYKAAINNLNDRKLRMLAELRSVEPLDQDGKYTDAVTNFLSVYSAWPADSVWKLRPTNTPAEGSTMLKDAAARIERNIPSFTAADAKKNLEFWQLDLLRKAKDPKATALAAKLGGAPADVLPTANTQTPATPKVGGTNAPEATAKETPTVVGDAAILLFNKQASEYESKGGNENMALAAATLLRIPAHYPSSSEAPVAMLRAAKLQKQLKHEDEAQRLFQAIVNDYEKTAAAREAKQYLQ